MFTFLTGVRLYMHKKTKTKITHIYHVYTQVFRHVNTGSMSALSILLNFTDVFTFQDFTSAETASVNSQLHGKSASTRIMHILDIPQRCKYVAVYLSLVIDMNSPRRPVFILYKHVTDFLWQIHCLNVIDTDCPC